VLCPLLHASLLALAAAWLVLLYLQLSCLLERDRDVWIASESEGERVSDRKGLP
jgi:hypothetical protein